MGIYAHKRQCHKLETELFLQYLIATAKHSIESTYPIKLKTDLTDLHRIEINFSHNMDTHGKRPTSNDLQNAKKRLIQVMATWGYSLIKETPLVLKLTQAGKEVLQQGMDSAQYKQQNGHVLSKISFNVANNRDEIQKYVFNFLDNTIQIIDLDSPNTTFEPLPVANDELGFLFRLARFGHYTPLYLSDYFPNRFSCIISAVDEEYTYSDKPLSLRVPTAFKANLTIHDASYELTYMGENKLFINDIETGVRKYNHECFRSLCFDKLNDAFQKCDKALLANHLKNDLFYFCKLTFPKLCYRDMEITPGPYKDYSEIVLFKEAVNGINAISFKASSVTVRNHLGKKVHPSTVFSNDELYMIKKIIKNNFGVNKPTMLGIIANIFKFDLCDQGNDKFIKNLYFNIKSQN